MGPGAPGGFAQSAGLAVLGAGQPHGTASQMGGQRGSLQEEAGGPPPVVGLSGWRAPGCSRQEGDGSQPGSERTRPPASRPHGTPGSPGDPGTRTARRDSWGFPGRGPAAVRPRGSSCRAKELVGVCAPRGGVAPVRGSGTALPPCWTRGAPAVPSEAWVRVTGGERPDPVRSLASCWPWASRWSRLSLLVIGGWDQGDSCAPDSTHRVTSGGPRTLWGFAAPRAADERTHGWPPGLTWLLGVAGRDPLPSSPSFPWRSLCRSLPALGHTWPAGQVEP